MPTAQLVEKARDPAAPLHEQHAAFAQLVEQSQHIVFGIALASLREVEDARDAAQDAFLTAWLRLGQLRDAFTVSGVVAEDDRRDPVPARPAATDPGAVKIALARWRSRPTADDLTTGRCSRPGWPRYRTASGMSRSCSTSWGTARRQIGRLLRLKPGTVGKRLHSAGLRVRRRLPPWVRGELVRPAALALVRPARAARPLR